MTDIIDQITKFAEEHNGQPWTWVHFTSEPGIVSSSSTHTVTTCPIRNSTCCVKPSATPPAVVEANRSPEELLNDFPD
ncbi:MULTISPECIES: hypothetical protein [unclassified Rhodococcus (in: high G+C Gram-positive bacteria)]|uniref:hypothetical protein n=1 Tax=unclassified Rhodococcus (in: high G+C Gram-positive bacteria) TaxID=192944 RepID=UPI001140002A|nr:MULTISPECIES: hypothetical protein [unclassified Rhodococcus (in: high G+C Gram-positive bacteria)]